MLCVTVPSTLGSFSGDIEFSIPIPDKEPKSIRVPGKKQNKYFKKELKNFKCLFIQFQSSKNVILPCKNIIRLMFSLDNRFRL